MYKDDNLTFEQLLKKDSSFTTHERNLQKWALLMYRVKDKLCPAPIQEIFTENENTPNFRNERDGDKGPVTWNLVPNEIKLSEALESFKTEIVKWKPQGCTCRLCKVYIRNFGFLN